MEGAVRAWFELSANEWMSQETKIVVEDQLDNDNQRHPRFVVRDEGAGGGWIFGQSKVMRVLLSASAEEEEEVFDSIKTNEIARHCAEIFCSEPTFSSCFRPFQFVRRYALILTSRPDAPLAVVETAVPCYQRLQLDDSKAGVDVATAFSLFTLRLSRGQFVIHNPRVVFPGVWKKPAMASKKRLGGAAVRSGSGDHGEAAILALLWDLDPKKTGLQPSPRMHNTEERLLASLCAGADERDKEELDALVLGATESFGLEPNGRTPARTRWVDSLGSLQ
eukprot:752801-Hanusia_phi.AAC.1